MPRWAKISQSNLAFCPILRMLSSSSSGFSEAIALGALKPLLEDESILKIGQNAKFDWLIFAQRGIEVAPYDDTMLISYVLDAGRSGHELEQLATRYFD